MPPNLVKRLMLPERVVKPTNIDPLFCEEKLLTTKPSPGSKRGVCCSYDYESVSYQCKQQTGQTKADTAIGKEQTPQFEHLFATRRKC